MPSLYISLPYILSLYVLFSYISPPPFILFLYVSSLLGCKICNCEKKHYVLESEQDEEKKKDGRMRMGLTLKKRRPKTPTLPVPSRFLLLLLSYRRGLAIRDSHTSF